MNTQKHRKVFFYSTLLLLFIFAGIIIFPFFKSLVTSMVLAFIIYPFYLKIKSKIPRENVATLITVILFFLVLLIPFIFIMNQFVKESTVAYISLKQVILGLPKGVPCSDNSTTCGFVQSLHSFLQDPQIKFYLSSSLDKVISVGTKALSDFLVTLPKLVMNIFIMLIALFYFLRDGERLVKRLESLLPLHEQTRKKIFHQFVTMSKAIVFGIIIAAGIQAIVALIGFYLLNLFFSSSGSPLINAPMLWAAVLFLFAMIPVLGSGIVWVPMSLFIILRGYTTESSSIVLAGMILFMYGLIVISNIDNIIRPLIAGVRAKVHPLIIFVGIFGGLIIFGLAGILIGPLILALTITYLKVYEEGTI